MVQQQGRPEVFHDPHEWYAQAQAKSVYLECRGQRGIHPKDAFFWIERACLPQSGQAFEMVKTKAFFLLEYILLSKALIAVASPHYFSRGWCLFEFACKLASTPSTDSAALGVAWKAFVNFGSRKDGFDAKLYVEVIAAISIEKAEFSVNADRNVLLLLVDRLFTSRSAFDRFAKFAALSRLGRSCYTREDRQPFSVLARAEGFKELAELLDCTRPVRVRYRYTAYAVYGNADLGTDGCEAQGPSTKGPGLHVGAKVSLEVHTDTTLGEGDQVHFNRGVAGSQRFARLSMGTRELGPRSAEHWQWLSHGLEEALLSFIQRAGDQWGLRCAFYEAHYPPVIRALADAKRRGASLGIVLDWKAATWSEDRKAPMPPLCNQSQQIYRFAVARRDANCCVVLPSASVLSPGLLGKVLLRTGSTNITAGAIFGHSNVGHIVTQPDICQKYLKYWERLTEDPEKKDLAALNEKATPLPSEENWKRVVLFSPRLRWAEPLAFIAQLILRARSSVAFTAAFGIGREVAPALLAAGSEGAGVPIPTYLLLESQGNWQASKDAVQALQSKANVRVAFGMHLEAGSEGDLASSRGGWLPEKLTGLNEHVRYVHTKILLIDMFSDEPIVITGSGNFSRASMESNDENMLLIRGDRNFTCNSEIDFKEVTRMLHHPHQRKTCETHSDSASDVSSCLTFKVVMCRCGQAVAERTVKKEGPNTGRKFRCCANPVNQQCGYFAWLDDPKPAKPQECLKLKLTTSFRQEVLPWPRNAFEQSFERMERLLLAGLWSSNPRPVADAKEEEESFYSAESSLLEAVLDACGVSEEPFQDLEAEIPSRQSPDTLTEVRKVGQKLMSVETNRKGGSAEFRDLSQQLVDLVNQMPDTALREPVLGCLNDMQKKFLGKTKASWQPQLQQAASRADQTMCWNQTMHSQPLGIEFDQSE
eukprot:symbB.v1.2.015991.t1/scaffold1193.1/size133507/10